MHSNIWWTLLLTSVPSGLFLLIALILWLTKKGFVKLFFFVGLGLLFFPVSFLFGHFSSESKEMKKRTGTYVVTEQHDAGSLCNDSNFASLKLTLNANGTFEFNWKPCFADRINGSWKWTDDMVGTYTTFDKINDSLYLHFPSDEVVESIKLLKYQKTYMTFTRTKSEK